MDVPIAGWDEGPDLAYGVEESAFHGGPLLNTPTQLKRDPGGKIKASNLDKENSSYIWTIAGRIVKSRGG